MKTTTNKLLKTTKLVARKKLFEIKVYEHNTKNEITGHVYNFYRAESEGLSIPSRTIKGAINKVLEENWLWEKVEK